MTTATIGGTRVRREAGGESFALLPGSELGAGGQATVYPVPGSPDRVAKVYRDPTPEQERKLRLMLARRPAGATGIFAWPLELLRDEEGGFAGLLLPRVEGKLRLFELYNPATRRDRAPLFHHGLLHRAARNLAAAFHKLHEAGFVVGDVNESNVLVGEDGRVVLIDTDSFQVRDPATGEVFRCPVGRPEFTPPELSGRSFADVDRAPEHDRFGLGVLVFQMLMEGTHPFAGRFRGEGEPPSVQERIAAGHFPYSGRADVPLEPPRTAPPLDTLDPALRALLLRCFEDGHRDPAARPTAAEWRDALAAAEAALATCERNEQHVYGEHLDACPWCERARRLEGRDPFPSMAAVLRGEHRPRPAPARAPRSQAPAAALRPRFQAVAGAGRLPLPVPLPDALFGLAFLVSLVGMVSMTIPPLPVALIAGGLLFAARRMTQPGGFSQAATVLTVVLVGLGYFVQLAQSSGTREPLWTPPPVAAPDVEPMSIAGIGDPGVPTYSADEVDRKPVLLDPQELADAVATVPLDVPATSDPDNAVALLIFTVDEAGRVAPGSVSFPGVEAPGSARLAELERLLRVVWFEPGMLDGRAVRTKVLVPVRSVEGRASVVFRDELTGFEPFLGPGSLPGTTAPRDGSPPVDVADAEVKPRLLNADEVQAVLAGLYPPILRDAGVTGTTVMKFVVNAGGQVEPTSIQAVSTTHDAFAEASAAVVARMRFSPARVEGQAVPVLVQIPISWTLERG
ncbi:MAG TPA: TonB family protein [Longimicrobiaceae bacterium]|jgi:TonB family protein